MTELTVNGFKVDDSVTLEYIANPKRSNTAAWKRYDEYQKAATIGEYIELAESKFSKADLRYDESKGHLKLFNSDGVLMNPPEEPINEEPEEVEAMEAESEEDDF